MQEKEIYGSDFSGNTIFFIFDFSFIFYNLKNGLSQILNKADCIIFLLLVHFFGPDSLFSRVECFVRDPGVKQIICPIILYEYPYPCTASSIDWQASTDGDWQYAAWTKVSRITIFAAENCEKTSH